MSSSKDSAPSDATSAIDRSGARYVNDAFERNDLFDTVRVGDHVARMALEVETPFTLGVAGKWGAGKTSILRRGFLTLGGQEIQVEIPFGRSAKKEGGWNHLSVDSAPRTKALGWEDSLMNARDCTLCVWYSPWQHQQAENPLLPLLLEIRNQFSVRAKTSKVLRQGALAGLTLLERVIDGAAIFTGVTKRPLVTGTTEAVRKSWQESGADTRLDDGQRFQLLFEDAIQTVLTSLTPLDKNATVAQLEASRPKGRLVVFIDDLDRCEEKAVVELLEAIKLYLAATDCVFVLGIDERAVLGALESYWPKRSPDDNQEYLEKLFQAVVRVPLPSPTKMTKWVAGQLKLHEFKHSEACATIIVDVVERNPRKIKNFVNSLCAAWQLHGRVRASKSRRAAERKTFEKRLVLMLYLRCNHKPIWRLLERDVRILRIITRELVSGDPTRDVDRDLLKSDFDPTDQVVLRGLIVKNFAHVLGRDKNAKEPALSDPLSGLGKISIEEAVKLLEERVDRKRSDQKFLFHYETVFKPGDDLPKEFLYLPDLEGGDVSENQK